MNVFKTSGNTSCIVYRLTVVEHRYRSSGWCRLSRLGEETLPRQHDNTLRTLDETGQTTRATQIIIIIIFGLVLVMYG